MFIDENPVRLAKKIAEAIRNIPTTETTVAEARARLRQRRDTRSEPQSRKGPEYVVENLVRPWLEQFLSWEYEIPPEHLPFWIASSHYHSGNDKHAAKWWRLFKTRHPKADTRDDTNSLRRADLFVATLVGGIVSIELKLLRARNTLDNGGSVKQVKQSLSPGDRRPGHDAALIVVYEERPWKLQPSELEARLTADLLTADLAGKAFPVVLEGPPVGV